MPREGVGGWEAGCLETCRPHTWFWGAGQMLGALLPYIHMARMPSTVSPVCLDTPPRPPNNSAVQLFRERVGGIFICFSANLGEKDVKASNGARAEARIIQVLGDIQKLGAVILLLG